MASPVKDRYLTTDEIREAVESAMVRAIDHYIDRLTHMKYKVEGRVNTALFKGTVDLEIKILRGGK